MYNRRNSLQRSSSKRYSQGLSPAAAAAMVSFNQQNPRQNTAQLAANAAAEALRRHSLDAEGAQAAANFGRRSSITSQSGDRRNSLQRRDSITQSQRVSARDQYGRAMSLTTTTVRQMGSFEIVKQQTTPVRPPRVSRAPESLYSLESLREEPEQQHHQSNRKGRVSFMADTSEFHYDSYNYEEPNALAAAAAVARGPSSSGQQPSRGGRLQPPRAQRSQAPVSPMKSALKKPFEEQHDVYDEREEGPYDQFDEQYEEQQQHYADPHESQYEPEQYDGAFEDHSEEFVTRPLSTVSEFSAITAKEDFDSGDSVSDLEEYEREFAPASVPGAVDPVATESVTETETFTTPETPEAVPTMPPSMSAADVSSMSPKAVTLKNPQEPEPVVLLEQQQQQQQPRAEKVVRNGVHPAQTQTQAPAPMQTQTQAQAPARTQPLQPGAKAAARALGQRPQSQAQPQARRVSQPPPARTQPVPRGQPAPRSQAAPRNQQSAYPQPPRAQARGSQQPSRAPPARSQGRANSMTYQYAPRTLQPSPSIDGFNRISNTSDIIQQAKARARAYSQDHPPAGFTPTIAMDDTASINSDSSWKRERASRAKPSRFRGRAANANAGASANGTNGAARTSDSPLRGPPPVAAPRDSTSPGRRNSASSFGASLSGSLGRVQSSTGGRTYSLRGQAPPDMNRKWRSRFEDSDEEDAAPKPQQMLPRLVDTPTKQKKKGFFKRLFSKS